jgi:hypothetical protein
VEVSNIGTVNGVNGGQMNLRRECEERVRSCEKAEDGFRLDKSCQPIVWPAVASPLLNHPYLASRTRLV